MPLDPTLKRYITKAYLAGFSDIEHLSLMDRRNIVRPSPLKVNKASYKDYNINSHLSVRVYNPVGKNWEDITPGVVHFPGTGFVFNRLLINDDYCSLLANRLQMRIINVCYRLSPEYKFLEILQDGIDSILWTLNNSELLNIIPEKISLWAESSGATLAVSCTYYFQQHHLRPIAYQTLFYPRVDLITHYESMDLYQEGYLLDKKYLQWLDDLSYASDEDFSNLLISPLHATDFTGLPSMHILTAEYDPLRDAAHVYAAKLQQANVPVKLECIQGLVHGFTRFYERVEKVQVAVHSACDELVKFAHNSKKSCAKTF